MKKLFESDAFQAFFARLIVGYLRFCYRTTQWTHEGREATEAIWDRGGPALLLLWHQRVHYAPACWPLARAQKMAILVSLSKSGDFSVRTNTLFGYHIIRGSAAKKSDPTKQKGGAAAFRDMLRWIRAGHAVALTPDGPRGPARDMTEGSLKLSQMSGAPLILIGQSSSRFLSLNSWDRQRIPLPFAKGAMLWEVMPPVPADADEAALEAIRIDAGARLTALTDRADTMTGAL
ncbi:lysophospholipid acyltransferase family protein [Asticcacaulis sp. BYS171W]|uniref:Lysophospholipid acyltransferase family protein n=1 Tax=Asticcacaulis aquaticus TaxID=2984212 RepID=A0ABT5HZT1_9CAUL|nr:lysophospholipid acyltransferase family protein [Asticcacaulis aquaticus]MDC7684936.1 lysophospholipid acyltransferase family protein [Asticcacaulis aquaticus]